MKATGSKYHYFWRPHQRDGVHVLNEGCTSTSNKKCCQDGGHGGCWRCVVGGTRAIQGASEQDVELRLQRTGQVLVMMIRRS